MKSLKTEQVTQLEPTQQVNKKTKHSTKQKCA